MSAFWITLNFVMLLLVFYLILHLYQRIRILEKNRSDDPAVNADRLLSEHIKAVRLENQQLLEQLNTLLTEYNSQQSSKNRTVHSGKNTEHSIETNRTQSGPASTFAETLDSEKEQLQKKEKKQSLNQNLKNKEEWVPPIDDIQDQVEQSPYLQAVKLQEKGYSLTEIAKKMNRGEGEVELLLKLHGKVQS
ncbi:DUF2802 domain-containing protein [Sporolactobacillus sp. CPB3-1]|uniref:DUF2802 domain-containing protein n=1 Tax=Sporolactobacillus mangiferae TaxID=2940498 RepID=A0ABT0M9B9_9BACL|nr:DUF2802 domain-containing protein [Sporolactobacillus mangiferae]MCL1630859.1 DUF2802 domain-containing protein [Sporolactobacillus mangiferae]